jgi:cell cycle checkpoint protein
MTTNRARRKLVSTHFSSKATFNSKTQYYDMSRRLSSSQSSPSKSRRRGGGDGRTKHQRVPLRPPQRLSWPPASLSSQESTKNGRPCCTKESVDDEESKVKWIKPERVRFAYQAQASKDSSKKRKLSTEKIIWVEKYIPKSSTDLCIAPKKVKEIKEWMHQSVDHNTRNKKLLLILVGSPGVGKSTCIRVLAKEMHMVVQSWNESFQPRSQGIHPNNLLAVEQSSALDSFQEFLQQSGVGFSPLELGTLSDQSYNHEQGKSLILLEELPNLHRPEAELKFRTIMNRHIQRSLVPTIIIFSDVSEGKHRPEDLERLIDPSDLYNQERSTILQIHSVTKTKMGKVLTSIAKQENISLGPNFLEELHSQSRGDLRHAIMTLQLHATGNKMTSFGSLQNGHSERDTKLSTFHSLGKLLYGKRTFKNGQSRLAFDPDAILERSDMGLEGSLRFLEYHSLDFFSDVTDLSNAYRYFSDAVEILDTAATTLSRDNRHGQHELSITAYPYGCAAAIAGRAVTETNKHPTPNKFRHFVRPKVFDVIRIRKQNEVLVEQLSRRLSLCHQSFLSSIFGEDRGIFVTEVLPLLRVIMPQEVDPVVNNLYSVAGNKFQQHTKNFAATTTSTKDKFGADDLKLQEEIILAKDDIAEFDSDIDY